VGKKDEEKPAVKTRFTTKLFFWFFIVFAVMAIFLFWTLRGDNSAGVGQSRAMTVGLGASSACLSVFFALVCFVRFIRSRSITGGLFLTTCISTGVFLGTSQVLPIVVPPTAAAFSAAPDVTNNGLQLMVVLAQVGLFAIWFAFLLFTIFLYVQPVKRIDKYLGKIIDGDDFRRVKIGNARQYKAIEEKIRTLKEQ
jgi:hypothetical protein